MAVCQILPVGLVEVNNNTCKSSIQRPEFTIEEMKEKNGHQQGIWTSIQERPTTNKDTTVDLPPPYVHPLLRRPASFMSQSSLELCTESLGSETGSDGFSDMEEDDYHHSSSEDQEEESEEEQQQQFETLKYSFPPPLSSISRSEIRAQRRDGRLVMEALPLPSQNYLCCQRQGGRLLLSFIDPVVETEAGSDYEQGEDDVVDGEVEDSDEEEEKVEVVDEGMVVQRSTLLAINRFVGGDMEELLEKEKADALKWKLVPRNNMAVPNTLVDPKKVAVNRREVIIQQTRRCGMQQRRSLFIWEPCNSAAAT